MQKIKKKGLIKKIGISIYNTFELNNILKIFEPDIIQFPYNVFNQEFNNKSLLKSLKKRGILLQARSIFLQGALLKNIYLKNKYFKLWDYHFDIWFKYLKEKKVSAEEFCINFALSNELIDNFVIGVNSISQLKKNINFIKSLNKKKSKYNNQEIKNLAINDQYLIDPRLWSKNIIKNKNYTKWNKAKKFIPAGGMFLSKKPEQFLPGGWPPFYNKAKGCYIWDSNNKKYLDFSLMGVGTNILGYSNDKINNKVKEALFKSNVSTLNSDADLKLSKKIIELHDWSTHCLFARTGAEANAVAVRLARAYTGKDEIAVCGYHGWHDWYLSANLHNNKSLDKMHLSGLSTIGIPKKLRGLTHPFYYNDFNSLKKLLNNNKNIGTIFMEVERNQSPKNKFLNKVKKIAEKNNIILIFDECTSGFRETFGGLHKKYKVNPDIAVFGKSLGNGIPIAAILLRNNIFSKGKESFISSTFWSDNLGPVSALATLEEMQRKKSWLKIKKIGIKIKKFWVKMSKKYRVDIEISGLDAMPIFRFKSLKHEYYKTYITQEFLKRNILSTNTVYCSTSHEEYLHIYFKNFEKIFKKIKSFEEGLPIIKYLNHPLPNSSFARLN